MASNHLKIILASHFHRLFFYVQNMTRKLVIKIVTAKETFSKSSGTAKKDTEIIF